MAGTSATLAVSLTARTSSFESGMKQAAARVKEFERTAKTSLKEIGLTQGEFQQSLGMGLKERLAANKEVERLNARSLYMPKAVSEMSEIRQLRAADIQAALSSQRAISAGSLSMRRLVRESLMVGGAIEAVAIGAKAFAGDIQEAAELAKGLPLGIGHVAHSLEIVLGLMTGWTAETERLNRATEATNAIIEHSGKLAETRRDFIRQMRERVQSSQEKIGILSLPEDQRGAAEARQRADDEKRKVIQDLRDRREAISKEMLAINDKISQLKTKTETTGFLDSLAKAVGPKDSARSWKVEAIKELKELVDTREALVAEEKMTRQKIASAAAAAEVAIERRAVAEITDERAKATQKALEKQSEIIQSLSRQAEMFGKSSAQIEIYNLKMAGASPAVIKQAQAIADHVDALEKQNKLMEQGKHITEQNLTPIEKYKTSLDSLLELYRAHGIGIETLRRATAGAGAEFDKAQEAAMPKLGAPRFEPLQAQISRTLSGRFDADVGDQQKKIMMDQLGQQKEHTRELREIIDILRKGGIKEVGLN